MPAERSSRAVLSHKGAVPYENEVVANAARALFPPRQSGGIAFAPNVTPGTFNDPPPPLDDDDLPPAESLLFPTETLDADSATSSTGSRPRASAHGRKKPENYIPRPPNAFILFRSAFIKNRNVSTNVETNHSTLSKIIGLTWQNLPEQEKRVWHRKAKLAEAEHRLKFPQYAFKPVHSKDRKALKAGSAARKAREVGPKDHVRCAKIAEFLVQGMKGEALDAAIEEFDKGHVREVVTRFEAPITEESFAAERSPSRSPSQEPASNKSRPGSAPLPDSAASLPTGKRLAAMLGKQPRSVSSASSRRPSPYRNFTVPAGGTAVRVHSLLSSSLAPPFEMEHGQQQHLYSLEHFSFDQAKHDHTSKFSSFGSAFSSSDIHSLPPPFDANSTPAHSIAHSFSPAPSSIPSPHSQTHSLPELHIDSSYITDSSGDKLSGNPWSPCHSQRSLPSTNGMSSMPPTPYSSAGMPLPEDGYASVQVYQQHQFLSQPHHPHHHAIEQPPPEYTMHPQKYAPGMHMGGGIPPHMTPSHFANSDAAYQGQAGDGGMVSAYGSGNPGDAGQYPDPYASGPYDHSSSGFVGDGQEVEYHPAALQQQHGRRDSDNVTIQCPSPVTPIHTVGMVAAAASHMGGATGYPGGFGAMMPPPPSYSL